MESDSGRWNEDCSRGDRFCTGRCSRIIDDRAAAALPIAR